jgi:ribose transport system permease protein
MEKTITDPSTQSRGIGSKLAAYPSLMIWIVIVIILLLTPLVSVGFLDPTHLLNVARKASGLGIVAVGQTLVILTGGLDLSNGMVITVVDVVAATILNGTDTLLVPVVLLCLAIGVVVGLANGLLVTKLKVPPLVGTLGMFGILKGIAYVYTNGAPKGNISPSLRLIGSGLVGQVPITVFVWVGITILGVIVLRKTIFGRHLYAVGGNRQAARLSGVRVNRVIVMAYVSSSLLAAVAGLVLAGYIGTGSLGLGDGYNLNSIAAVVVGGTAFSGGVGTVIGSAGGSLFLAIVFSLLRFLGLSYSNQLVVQGAILAFAIYAHSRTQR